MATPSIELTHDSALRIACHPYANHYGPVTITSPATCPFFALLPGLPHENQVTATTMPSSAQAPEIFKHLVHEIRLSAVPETFVRRKAVILSIRFLMTMDPSPPDLLFIRDPLNDLNFMIDTGSSSSLWPSNLPYDQTKAKEKMFAANGSEVMLFETFHLIIPQGMGRHLPWQFTTANVRFPVIGMDFLRIYGLIVDTVKQCLHNATTTGSEGKKKPAVGAIIQQTVGGVPSLLLSFPKASFLLKRNVLSSIGSYWQSFLL